MKLLTITAKWCPSCIVMNSRLEKIKAELPWLSVEEFDYDKDIQVREQYQIGKEIPIFILLDQAGAEINRLEGEIDRKDFIKILMENKER